MVVVVVVRTMVVKVLAGGEPAALVRDRGLGVHLGRPSDGAPAAALVAKGHRTNHFIVGREGTEVGGRLECGGGGALSVTSVTSAAARVDVAAGHRGAGPARITRL